MTSTLAMSMPKSVVRVVKFIKKSNDDQHFGDINAKKCSTVVNFIKQKQ